MPLKNVQDRYVEARRRSPQGSGVLGGAARRATAGNILQGIDQAFQLANDAIQAVLLRPQLKQTLLRGQFRRQLGHDLKGKLLLAERVRWGLGRRIIGGKQFDQAIIELKGLLPESLGRSLALVILKEFRSEERRVGKE